MNVKLLLGGLMLGDAFHTIPVFNRLLREGVTNIHWTTGTYEQTAVEFLQKFYPITATFHRDGNPTDISARFGFSKEHSPEFDNVVADRSIIGVEASMCGCSFESDISLFILNNIESLGEPGQGHIVLHPQTIHHWKTVPGIAEADWVKLGLPCYTVGHTTESLIPGTLDFRGKSFLEVAKLINSARLVVGIHSAIACLTLYLNKPMIVCHPWREPIRSGFLHFGDYRSIMKDFYQPPPDRLLELAQKMLSGENVVSDT